MPQPQPQPTERAWVVPALVIGAFLAWKALMFVTTDEEVMTLPRRRMAGGKLSDAEITKKFKSCIRQVNEREARKYAEGQPPDAFVDIDKAHAVCRSRFNAKYGSDTMKRVVAAMRSSGSYVKATPEHIRRKALLAPGRGRRWKRTSRSRPGGGSRPDTRRR